MIIRSAVLEGEVAPEHVEEFDSRMRGIVLPAIALYPGLIKVELRKIAEPEAGAPPVYMIFDLHFPSLAAMHAALASDVRQAVRHEISQGMSLFKGRVYHTVLQQIEQKGGSSS
ncbi:hypothetical protein [Rhizobium sp. RU36D]|uniref:hypothetical protein n=1 Tax=Rhizobium sp. RU36D TaxID=1907415 RepID=UPI0009D8368A|nr:hypothetical protein [Rhizobium sp. RU36D]SMD12690.1 hypothetical protein SAMN05880593_12417 [Rhizobium sp. RU36D]